MKHEWLWLLAIACLFIDAGMTLILMQNPSFSESNETVRSYMEQMGEKAGMMFSVGLRMFVIGVVMAVSENSMTPDWLFLCIVVPAAVAPVLWNTAILFL